MRIKNVSQYIFDTVTTRKSCLKFLLPLLLAALSVAEGLAISNFLDVREPSVFGDGGNRTQDCCVAAWHANTLATPHPHPEYKKMNL